MLSTVLVPIRAIKEYRPKSYLVEKHEHPYFHMLYVESGKLIVFCSGSGTEVAEADTILIPPHSDHMIYSLDNTHTFELKFACQDELERLTARFSAREYWLWASNSGIGALLSSVMTEAENKGADYLEIISCRIYDLLMRMLRELETPEERRFFEAPDEEISRARDDCPDQLISKAVEYTDAHLTDRITVAELARHFGYSSSYFSTVFKKNAGISPQRFITLRKIACAKEMIRKGDMSLSAISDALNFCSVAAFTNTFKSYCGVTPGQYSMQTRSCVYINLSETADLPADNVRSIEPIHRSGVTVLTKAEKG